jgi:hypothetical protein
MSIPGTQRVGVQTPNNLVALSGPTVSKARRVLPGAGRGFAISGIPVNGWDCATSFSSPAGPEEAGRNRVADTGVKLAIRVLAVGAGVSCELGPGVAAPPLPAGLAPLPELSVPEPLLPGGPALLPELSVPEPPLRGHAAVCRHYFLTQSAPQ